MFEGIINGNSRIKNNLFLLIINGYRIVKNSSTFSSDVHALGISSRVLEVMDKQATTLLLIQSCGHLTYLVF